MACAVGLGEQLIGISHECDYPTSITHLPRLSASSISQSLDPASIDQLVRDSAAGLPLNTISDQLLQELQPNLILTQGLCDVCAIGVDLVATAQRNADTRARILSLDGSDFEGVLADIGKIASVAGCSPLARSVTDKLRQQWQAPSQASGKRVLFVEWPEPPFFGGHWVPEMIERAGGVDVMGKTGQKSGTFEWHDAALSGVDVMIFAGCGFNLDRNIQLADEFSRSQTFQLFEGVQLWAIDANAFTSRPGPRLIDGKRAIASLLGSQEPLTGISARVL